MPVPKSRDPELARRELERWLAVRLEHDSLRVTRFDMPRTSGFSNETMLFDVELDDADGEWRALELVARVAPAAYVLFPDYDLELQRRVMCALAPTAVPTPKVLWSAAADDSPFGQDFFVMERVAGRPVDDYPPYTKRGWLLDATPEVQRRVFHNGMRQLITVAEVDWKAAGLEFLSDPRFGDPGIDQELAYWAEFLAWVVGDREIDLLRDAYDWLRANVPPQGPLRLSWGDSRPGNILYDVDGHAAAVLDWEMASLCPREADLAWWLNYQVVQTHGYHLPELPGFPERAEAIRLYEELAGEAVHDLPWWEVFAAFRVAVILLRLGDMMKAVGLLPEGAPPVEGPTFRALEHARSRT
jgi:aminoglycoside phosphotransferase (APT) family kinase protein